MGFSQVHRRYDTVVIGAGVVGAAIAHQLARRGLAVAVLERAPGIGGGCSYANAAILAPSHVTPLATPPLLREAPRQILRRPPVIRVGPEPRLLPWLAALSKSAFTRAGPAGEQLRQLATDSARLHVELAEAGLNPGLRKTGALDVFLKTPKRGRGDLLTPEQVKAIAPTLAPVAAGRYDDEEWVVESRGFGMSMLADAQEHGADVLFGTAAEELVQGEDRITAVVTSAGTLVADHLVLAAGMGSAPLAAQVGVPLPLRGGRGYVTDFDAEAPPLPVRVSGHRIVITPLSDRVRVSGVLEFGQEGKPFDRRRPEAMRAAAAQALPGLADARIIDQWAGERPCTPDGLPVVGRSERIANLSVATGHGMWGLILAPMTARLIAEAIMAPSSSGEREWLAPDRFGAARTRASRMAAPRYDVPSVSVPPA